MTPSVPYLLPSERDAPEGLQNLLPYFGTLFELVSRAEGTSLVDIVKQIALRCNMCAHKYEKDGKDEAQAVADFAGVMLTSRDYWTGSNHDMLEKCFIASGAEHGNAKRYTKVMCNESFDRHLVRISNGCYGMAPLYTKPKDVVCVVFGCPVPLVLRPKGTEHQGNAGEFWQLIGDCFVHGVMEVS
jgi:hypothetical protein